MKYLLTSLLISFSLHGVHLPEAQAAPRDVEKMSIDELESATAESLFQIMTDQEDIEAFYLELSKGLTKNLEERIKDRVEKLKGSHLEKLRRFLQSHRKSTFRRHVAGFMAALTLAGVESYVLSSELPQGYLLEGGLAGLLLMWAHLEGFQRWGKPFLNRGPDQNLLNQAEGFRLGVFKKLKVLREKAPPETYTEVLDSSLQSDLLFYGTVYSLFFNPLKSPTTQKECVAILGPAPRTPSLHTSFD